jgi:hypothetical protein
LQLKEEELNHKKREIEELIEFFAWSARNPKIKEKKSKLMSKTRPNHHARAI